MSDKTGIEWTDATWNPVTGCTKVSPGCDHCYAETMHERFNGKGSFATVELHPDRLDKPLHWKKPRRIFVNSMSDLFHPDVPDEFVLSVWKIMARTPHHTFQILTKRHARMRSFVRRLAFASPTREEQRAGIRGRVPYLFSDAEANWKIGAVHPLENVWLGVSVESQQWAGIRVPALLDTPAAVRFLSCEPLLGPVDLLAAYRRVAGAEGDGSPLADLLHWVIVGGESGPGARPMEMPWPRSLRDQCVTAGVPFLFKQWGLWAPDGSDRVARGFAPKNDQMMLCSSKKLAGRELDGRTWDQYPAGVA